MKRYIGILTAVILCLVLAGSAYFWVTGLMDSLFAYRSPLHASPPTPGEPLGTPVTRRVVFVLVDALREDTSLRPEVMPFLNELRARGAWATMHSRPPSYSMPGYSVLLTGAWPDLSDGPALNLEYEETPTFTQDDLISAAHRAGLRTAISGYYWFERLVPQSAVSASFYTPGEDRFADRAVVDAALPWLRDGGYELVLIHLDQVDYAGHHEGGPRDPRWDEAARRADDLLREIAATLDLEQDTLFVCSDHGQIDRGGHGGQDAIVLVEPFVLVGAGVRPGHYDDVEMVDVAPTLATLLGANIPASSQGHVRTEMLTLDAAQQAAVERGLQAQQAALLTAYLSAIGRQATVAPGDDAVATHQAALQAARAARLNGERWPRALLALVVAFLPIIWLARQQRRDLVWWLGGGVLYLALFNLRYAVLDGLTYSLSSVVGANELILYCAVTVALALTVAWLVVSLGGRAFRRSPRPAAEATLSFVLVTIYLLALPVLFSLALNGAWVTWTLPDFASTFVAFLSGIQILFVAVVGLVLTGATALIAFWTAPTESAL
jgi:hypothetical protein